MNRRRRLIAALAFALPVQLGAAQTAGAELTVAAPEPQPSVTVEPAPPAPDVSVQPAAPAEQVQPAAPAEQVQPAAPAEQVQPAAPAEQVQPAAPVPEQSPPPPQAEQSPPPAQDVQVAQPAPAPEVQVAEPAPTPDVSVQTPPPEAQTSPAELHVAPPEPQPDIHVAQSAPPQQDLEVHAAPDPNATPVDATTLQGGAGSEVQAPAGAEVAQDAAGADAVQPASRDGGAQAQPAVDPADVDPEVDVRVAPTPAPSPDILVTKATNTSELAVELGASTAVNSPDATRKIRKRGASKDGHDLRTSDDAAKLSQSGDGLGRYRLDKKLLIGGSRISTLGSPFVDTVDDLWVQRRSGPDTVGHVSTKVAGGVAGAKVGLGVCAAIAIPTEGVGSVPCILIVAASGTAGSEGAGVLYDKVRQYPGLTTPRLTSPRRSPVETNRFILNLFAR